MLDIELLETIFGQETGLWDLPKTDLTEGGSYYDSDLFTVFMSTTDDDELYNQEFIWLHEAYHHYQNVAEGWDFNDDHLRDICSNVAYFGIPSEKQANHFAYQVCIKHGWSIPTYFPDGYFPK